MNNGEQIAVSATEAARLLGVSRPTIYQLCKRDDFPVFRVGSRTLISRNGLELWVKRQTEAKLGAEV